jgi:metallophosphoesterase
MPEKLIAISDIEGRYHEFKQFLIANKVMDKNYKWTFGKGHLVTVGDFFDRGLLVNQTLWLIYSLEEQAEKAGGKVHFILGNHDLMNMKNDFRYVRKKYLEDAKLMGVEYYDLYKPNTELGRWLATKNILEKIGDYIFIHAGISKEVSDLNLGVEGINKFARNFYFSNVEERAGVDPLRSVIYMYGKSPMWYRGYGKETIDKNEFVAIAKNMGAKKFVIGHTLHESVTYLMDKQVIDLDVLHAQGTTQGLLIENGQEYMVDIQGQKSAIKERAKEVDDD